MGDVYFPAGAGLCFGDPRGDAASISESEERLELGSDMDGSLNPQGGSAGCKAKMHCFQGASNYSPCQHFCTWGKSYSLRFTMNFCGSSFSCSLGGSIAHLGVEG